MTYTKDPVGAAECASHRSEMPSSSCDEFVSRTRDETNNLPTEPSVAGPQSWLSDSLNLSDKLVAAIATNFKDDHEGFGNVVAQLLEERAGLRRGPTWDNARRRLQNANLRTTYPDERATTLNKQILEYRKLLVGAMPQVIETALKLDMATVELARTEELKSQIKEDREYFEEHNVYPETVQAINRLYSEHRISRHNWATATDDQLQAIAEILRARRDTGEAA